MIRYICYTFLLCIYSCSSYSWVGRVFHSVGNIYFSGTGYLIDESFDKKSGVQSCEGKVYFVTANHVLRFSKMTDRPLVRFPIDDQRIAVNAFIEFEGRIILRDILSDLAVIEVPNRHLANVRSYLKCIGLSGKGFNTNDDVFIKGYPSFSEHPNQLRGNIFSVFQNSYLNGYFENWIVVNQYAEGGMSGGLIFDSKMNAIGMVLKRLIDSDPIKRPLTLAVNINAVGKRLAELLHGEVNEKFVYDNETDEIGYKGLTFKELEQNDSLMVSANNILENVGAEGHDIGAEAHDISGIDIEKYSNGVEITGVRSNLYPKIAEALSLNKLILVNTINGTKIKSLAHLLRVINSFSKDQNLDVLVKTVSPDGKEEIIFYGTEDKKLLHESITLFMDIVKELSADNIKVIDENYVLTKFREINVIMYQTGGGERKDLIISLNEVINELKKLKSRKISSPKLLRMLKINLYKLKSKYSGIRNEYF